MTYYVTLRARSPLLRNNLKVIKYCDLFVSFPLFAMDRMPRPE